MGTQIPYLQGVDSTIFITVSGLDSLAGTILTVYVNGAFVTSSSYMPTDIEGVCGQLTIMSNTGSSANGGSGSLTAFGILSTGLDQHTILQTHNFFNLDLQSPIQEFLKVDYNPAILPASITTLSGNVLQLKLPNISTTLCDTTTNTKWFLNITGATNAPAIATDGFLVFNPANCIKSSAIEPIEISLPLTVVLKVSGILLTSILKIFTING